jgi:hypothetical protein
MSFAKPTTTTLTLATGATLTVKRRLNSGDAREMKAMQAYSTLAEPAVVMAYLVDWTVTNDGTPVPVAGLSRPDLADVLNNLDEDAFDEIYAAVSAHRAAMTAERDAEKKTGGTPAEKKSSESPSAGASPSSASAPSTSTTTSSC